MTTQRRLVADLDAADCMPGDFEIERSLEYPEKAWIYFRCPCGCDDKRRIPIREGGKVNGAWQWDGNREVPTLSPSINCLLNVGDGSHRTIEHWHGYLRAGVWESV